MRLKSFRRIAHVLLIGPIAICLGASSSFAGHHEAAEKVGGPVEKIEVTAEELEENVEHSEKLMKKTYEADRKEGESVVEASGDAYEAVLEAGREKSED